MSLQNDLALYAVTDRTWLNGRSLHDCVAEALNGGVTMVQLREKHLADADFIAEARDIKRLCANHRVPFIVNDNLDVAMAVDADGIHVGQDDMSAVDIRKRWGKNKIVGVSAQTVSEAVQAEKDGADYLGVGAVFPTTTKTDAIDVPLPVLRDITKATSIPAVAIGGIDLTNTAQLRNSGIVGIAVISAIFAAKDITATSAKLLTASLQL